MRSLLVLLGLGLLAEVGWLALWPLGVALSHSPAFSAALLAQLGPLEASMPQPLGPALELGQPGYLGPASMLAALLAWLGAVYLALIVYLQRGGGARPAAAWLILGSSALFQLTLLGLPGLLSQDVFSYIAYGRLAADYGLNPYVWPPSAVAKDATMAWVAEVWRTYACPYGPLWVDAQWLLARLSGELPVPAQVLIYRACGALALSASLALVWRIVGRAQRPTALALLAWNPLVLLEVIGDAHNDGVMVALALLGVLLLGSTRSATLSLTLSSLVKYFSALGGGRSRLFGQAG